MAVDHPFAIVPLGLVGEASASAVCVYAVLAEAANRDQACWPSVKTIGDRTGQSEATVRRNLSELKDLGWVEVFERRRENGSQTSNTYKIRRVAPVTSDTLPPVTGDRPPLSSVTGPEPDPIEPDPMLLENKSYGQQADPFDEWWSEYPKKVDKKKARKAYVLAAKKTSSSHLLERMLRYRDQDDRVVSGFVKNPATWLNGENWDDEIQQAPVDEPKSDPRLTGSAYQTWVPDVLEGSVDSRSALSKLRKAPRSRSDDV